MTSDLKTPLLYDEDFYGWAEEQAGLLRAGRLGDLDITNIAEEIETLGRSEAAALRSSFRLIVLHLLKLRHEPERATRGWRVTIVRERINAGRILKDSPGLKRRMAVLFEEAYDDGRREAIAETGLPPSVFPVTPEITLDQVRDDRFLPFAAGPSTSPDEPASPE